MVITMVDHGQTVMVIPWSMMVSQGLNDDELRVIFYKTQIRQAVIQHILEFDETLLKH